MAYPQRLDAYHFTEKPIKMDDGYRGSPIF